MNTDEDRNGSNGSDGTRYAADGRELPQELCHCGRPLHYTDKRVEARVRKLVAELGPEVRVVVEGRAFLVPRHYIALHGLSAAEAATLGFREVRFRRQ